MPCFSSYVARGRVCLRFTAKHQAGNRRGVNVRPIVFLTVSRKKAGVSRKAENPSRRPLELRAMREAVAVPTMHKMPRIRSR